MPTYLYRAKKGSAELIQGQIEAVNEQEASSRIDALGLFLVSIEEKKAIFKASTKVSLKELVDFTAELSTLINSGSTLLASLVTIISETEQARLKPVLLGIVSEVKEGVAFSAALEKYPKIFPPLYVSLIKIGESSGSLGENLRRISEFLEDELDFRTNISSVLIYPLLIVSLGAVIIFVLLKFVIPKLVGVFSEMGQALPLPTLALVNVSKFFSTWWLAILSVIVLSFLAVKKWLKNPHNRLGWDKFKLSLPLLGELLKKIEISRITNALSILLKNGVPLDASLRVLNSTTGNFLFQSELGRIGGKIKEGASLSGAMKETKIFGPAFINAVTVGEDSGTLEKVLGNLSRDYSKQINRAVKNLLSLLEPALILSVGLVVGFVVLCMLLPIFEIDFNF